MAEVFEDVREVAAADELHGNRDVAVRVQLGPRILDHVGVAEVLEDLHLLGQRLHSCSAALLGWDTAQVDLLGCEEGPVVYIDTRVHAPERTAPDLADLCPARWCD